MDSVPFMVTLISCGQTAGGAAAPPGGPTSSVLFQNKRSRDFHGPYDSMRSAAGLAFSESAGGLDRGLDLLRSMFSMSSESESQRLIEVGRQLVGGVSGGYVVTLARVILSQHNGDGFPHHICVAPYFCLQAQSMPLPHAPAFASLRGFSALWPQAAQGQKSYRWVNPD